VIDTVSDRRLAAATSIEELRGALERYPPPTVVFNKSHSGSRMVARLLAAAGVFMGAHRNDSEDALPLVPVVERCVEDHYPDYDTVLPGSTADGGLARLAGQAFSQHLAGYRSGPWGWKLCESGYALPILLRLFPDARCVHLIRDGRDVAFANHVAPRTTFWRKVYIGDATTRYRNGLVFGRFSRTLYRVVPHRYNVQHWIGSVTTFRQYGALVGDRLLEVRYENLCRDFAYEANRLCTFANAPGAAKAIAELAPEIGPDRIGRFRRESLWKQRDVLRRAGPLLAELGYIERADAS
jgi:hypothetical protein